MRTVTGHIGQQKLFNDSSLWSHRAVYLSADATVLTLSTNKNGPESMQDRHSHCNQCITIITENVREERIQPEQHKPKASWYKYTV